MAKTKAPPDEGGTLRNRWRWCSCLGASRASSVVRQWPGTLLYPILVTCCLCGVGVAAVLVVSDIEANAARGQAAMDLSSCRLLMQQTIHDLMAPLFSMALFVRYSPQYQDAMAHFGNISEALLGQVQGLNPATYLQLAPMAKITQVFPVTNWSQKAVGLDILDDTAIPEDLQFAAEKRMTLRGPNMLYGENVLALIGGVAVYVPDVDPNATFGFPDDMKTECPKEFASQCYWPATRSKFWGFIWSITYWDSVISGTSAWLDPIRDHGYAYQLVQRPTELQATPGARGPDGEPVVVLARSKADLGSDPVMVTVKVPRLGASLPWTILITKQGGWEPVWKYPLIATVVIVSIIIGVLLFILLLYMRQHQRLLYALVPRTMVQSLFRGDTVEAMLREQEQKGQDGTRMLESGTPVEKLMDILAQLISGRMPDIRDVVTVRAAFLHGGQLFQPPNLKAQLQLNEELEDDVVNALVRELQGLGHIPGVDSSPHLFRNSTVGSQGVDEASVSKLSAALNAIVKHAASLRQEGAMSSDFRAGQALCAPALRPHGVSHRAHSAGPEVGSASESQLANYRLASPASLMVHHSASMLVEGLLSTLPPETLSSGSLALRSRSPSCLKLNSATNLGNMSPRLPPTEQLHSMLEASYGAWSFDAFALAEATDNHPLSTLLYFLVARSGLLSDLKIGPATMARLAIAIEDGYHCLNPYHNRTHAADVLQTMHTILLNSGMAVASGEKGYCPPNMMLACLLAAAGHDLGHTGVTNDFLIQSEDELATLYSDKSPMEHHHLATLFKLLKLPSYNILSHLPKDERSKIRKIVIDLVSATDMKNHFTILSQFSTVHRLASDTAPSVTPGHTGRITGGTLDGASTVGCVMAPVTTPLPIDDTEQLISLQMVLKCADLGHMAEALEVHCRWVECLEEEFFSQGDRERALGLPLSPLFDRNKPGASKSQVGFMDYVALPLFNNFACVFPGAKPMLDLALSTYKYWKGKASEGSQQHNSNPLLKLPTQTSVCIGPENA